MAKISFSFRAFSTFFLASGIANPTNCSEECVWGGCQKALTAGCTSYMQRFLFCFFMEWLGMVNQQTSKLQYETNLQGITDRCTWLAPAASYQPRTRLMLGYSYLCLITSCPPLMTNENVTWRLAEGPGTRLAPNCKQAKELNSYNQMRSIGATQALGGSSFNVNCWVCRPGMELVSAPDVTM